MKISVAMATYNGEPFLREQLDSIAAQTRLPDELVVCDDGSSDRTVEIICEFSRSAPFPVRIYRNPQKLGYGDNFLNVARKCRGDWIAFCDQDDKWLPNKLDTVARYFSVPGRNVVLIVHSALVVDQTLVASDVRYPNIKRMRICPGRDLPDLWFAGGLAMVFRADLVTRCASEDRGPGHGPRQEPLAHDAWICWLARILGDIAMLPNTLVLYRRHSAATTTKLTGSAGDIRASRSLPRTIVATLADRDAAAYRRMSAAMIAHSAAFGRIARQQEDALWRQNLLAAQERYRSHAEWLAQRGAAYGGRSLSSRICHLRRAIAMGGYFKYCGANKLLGLRALLKDIFASMIGDQKRNRLIGRQSNT